MMFVEKNINKPSAKNVYLSCDEGLKLSVKEFKEQSVFTVWSVENFFRRVFLPEGFPDSVSSDYVSYQIWDTIQAFASSISGSLATQAVLEVVGVGDESATPLAATLTWLMTRGAGMVGQIVFTWIQGTDLDHNCKKWRLFADITNDAAVCLELSGPLWPSWSFQGVLCLAGISRSLVGVAGGATRAAITQHQARSNNISDVAAKDGSQETLVNLAALLLNLIVLPWVGGDKLTVWILFFALTALHLFANYKAVKSLKFSTLNEARLLDTLKNYVMNGEVGSPAVVNESESVFLGTGLSSESLCGRKICLGSSLGDLLTSNAQDSKISDKLQTALTRDYYIIVVSESVVHIILSEFCKSSDFLQIYIKALFTVFSDKLGGNSSLEDHCLKFEKKLLNAGWNTTHFLISPLGWTVSIKKTT